MGGFVRKVYEREETWIGGWYDDRRLPCKRRKAGCEAELSVRIGLLHPMVGQNELEEYINPRWSPVITPSFCRLGRYSMPLLCADDATVHSTLRKRMGILGGDKQRREYTSSRHWDLERLQPILRSCTSCASHMYDFLSHISSQPSTLTKQVYSMCCNKAMADYTEGKRQKIHPDRKSVV